MTSRAYTAEEVREQLLHHIRSLVTYWDSEERAATPKDKLEGLASSILNVFDGSTLNLPAFKISCAPHADDKQFYINEGSNYYKPGMVINDCMLHEFFYRRDDT